MIQGLIARPYKFYLSKKFNIKNPDMIYNTFIRDYRRKTESFVNIAKIHRRGFSVQGFKNAGMTFENCHKYMSEAMYYSIYPINGRYNQWIDDKLTFKYMLSGTELKEYLPEYYYQIDGNKQVYTLMDKEYEEKPTVENIASFLEEKKNLAFKLVNGSIGRGFYKASFKDNKFYLNSDEYTKEGFIKEISKLKNYVVTEFLFPHKDLLAFSPNTINTLRLRLTKVDGKLVSCKNNMRFGTQASGFVDNYGAGGVLVFLDENGNFDCGNVLDKNKKNKIIKTHPDTGAALKGRVPLWEEVMNIKDKLSRCFPQFELIGVDVVFTSENKAKILEINSFPSMESLQLDKPVFEREDGEYFRRKFNR